MCYTYHSALLSASDADTGTFTTEGCLWWPCCDCGPPPEGKGDGVAGRELVEG